MLLSTFLNIRRNPSFFLNVQWSSWLFAWGNSSFSEQTGWWNIIDVLWAWYSKSWHVLVPKDNTNKTQSEEETNNEMVWKHFKYLPVLWEIIHVCDFVILPVRGRGSPTLSTTIENGKVETWFHLCQSFYWLRREAGHLDLGEAVTKSGSQGWIMDQLV